jgi:HK97 family phage portal protein
MEEKIGGVLGQSASEMYRKQPHLRTVVDTLARNVAQLGVHVFEMQGENDRVRNRTSEVAKVLRRPNEHTTTYELIYDLVADLALHDIAYWVIIPSTLPGQNYMIRGIRAERVGRRGGTEFAPEEYVYTAPNGEKIPIPAESVIVFKGWNPSSHTSGSPKVEALKLILEEQMYAYASRVQVWQKGGRVGTVISRPEGAAKWDQTQERKYLRAFERQTGGSNASGNVVMQEGMKLERMRFSAHEEDFIDASKLALSTVASVYNINPVMVGVNDAANYSNAKEFNRALYTNTLGPILRQITERINAFLIPQVESNSDLYVEFNIMEKLSGSFEEQAAGFTAGLGGHPYMTVNDVRARMNLPRIEGFDMILTPTNNFAPVAAPKSFLAEIVDEPIARKAIAGVQVKAASDKDSHEQKFEKVLRAFFKRQSASVISKLNSKAASDFWDEDRWNRELTADLLKLSTTVTASVAAEVAEKYGFDPETYSVEQTIAWLTAVAESNAENINAATKDRLDEAIDSEDEELTPETVFEEASTTRTTNAAVALATTYVAFATVESSKQYSDGKALKTWVVTSSNPRRSHAKMDGQTVGIDEKFSNGANWPGDPRLGADGVAGCTCAVETTFP